MAPSQHDRKIVYQDIKNQSTNQSHDAAQLNSSCLDFLILEHSKSYLVLQVRYDSLTEAVRLLGCFSSTVDIQPIVDGETVSDNYQMFEEFFYSCKESRLVLQTWKVLCLSESESE